MVVLRRLANCIWAALSLSLAVVAAGCSGSSLGESQFFSKPLPDKPTWAGFTGPAEKSFARAVGPEDLVDAAGFCTAQVEAAPDAAAAPALAAPDAQPQQPGAPQQLSGAQPQPLPSASAGAPVTPGAPAVSPAQVPLGGNAPYGGAPAVVGGVGLGMTECDVVRRAGQPGSVQIGANPEGERTAVLTYLGGNWPGIYHFESGRLKIIDRAPEPPPAPKKQPRRKRRSAAGSAQR